VSHHSSAQCELLQLQGYLTPDRLDFESGNSPIHYSPFDHFCPDPKAFCFFHFLFSLYQIHFKKEKLSKRNLLNASEASEKFFLNRSVINTYEIFNGHIGGGYREIQETGAHR